MDGALQVLLVAGLIRAQNDHGKLIDFKSLERKAIGKTIFKVESTTVTTAQRIQVRKLLQKVGLSAKQGEELAHVPQFLEKLIDLSNQAGGDAPKPKLPDTSGLEEIRLTAGNEQLLALYNRRDELVQSIDSWSSLAKGIGKRWPNWIALKRLAGHAAGIQDTDVFLAQVDNIEKQRQLLEEPDLVSPLVNNLTQLLREELNRLDKDYQSRHAEGMKRLKNDTNWQKLDPEQRNSLLASQKLTLADALKIDVATTDEIVATLGRITVSAFGDRVAAMPSRFDAVLVGAVELMEPKVQFVRVPRRMLRTEKEIDVWLLEMRDRLKMALAKGPIVIQ